MKKISVLVGALVIVSLLSACSVFDSSLDRSDSIDSNSGSHSGHHH